MKKPAFLSRDEYQKFISSYMADGWKCSYCGAELEATKVHWDHIVPRSRKDERGHYYSTAVIDVASNMQLLCPTCNNKKYNKPDTYWTEKNYFDYDLIVSNLRTAQLDYIYNCLAHQYAEVFSLPISVYAGRLFLFPQIVGAGKTLGGFVAPFAINAARNGMGDGVPRVRRMLYLCKDQAIRDQVFNEVRYEPMKLGIVDRAPRVLLIDKADYFLVDGMGEIQASDIAVVCIQTIWNRKNSILDNDTLHRALALFELINVDECHFASNKQVANLVRKASMSVCIGLTASPIDKNGHLDLRLGEAGGIGRISPRQQYDGPVRVSVFGYQAASKHDHSMKGLGETSYRQVQANLDLALVNPKHCAEADQERKTLAAMYSDVILRVGTESLEREQQWKTYEDGDLDDRQAIRNSLQAPKRVAEKVVEYMKSMDMLLTSESVECRRMAEHRGRNAILGNGYYVHAIIRVRNIEHAESVADFLNEKFESDRGYYPRQLGWHAVAAHGGIPERDIKSRPLDDDNSWYKMRDDQGNISAACSRILVVCELAKEGINNKYCAVTGLGDSEDSLRSLVQILGRMVRSTHSWGKDEQGNRVLVVPPKPFDEIRIVVHDSLITGAEWKLSWALQFMEYMESSTSRLQSIEEFMARFDFSVALEQEDAYGALDFFEKLYIAEFVGRKRYNTNGERLTNKAVRALMQHFNVPTDTASGSHPRAIAVRDWIDMCERLPHKVKDGLKVYRHVPPERIASRDIVNNRATSDQIAVYADTWLEPGWNDGLTEDKVHDLRERLWRGGCRKHFAGEFACRRTLDDVANELADKYVACIEPLVRMSRARLRAAVAEPLNDAINLALGTNDYRETTLNDNASVVTHTFTNAQFKNRLYGFVSYVLASQDVLTGLLLCCDIEKSSDDDD